MTDSVEEIFKQLISGDRSVLAQLLTYVESKQTSKKELAINILKKCLAYEGKAIKIGVTGLPGAGKSTFINALAKHWLTQDVKIAVLAIDPTSEFTAGSILGDKTRMVDLVSNDKVFIRPTPTSGNLGGVVSSAYNTILLFEAAGYDVIFIETVGVGQSETFVRSLTDFVLLITLSGTGDELQGIKKGILEITDFIIVNKDENNSIEVKNTLAQLKYSFSLTHNKQTLIPTQFFSCSSIQNKGIAEIFDALIQFYSSTKQNNILSDFRLKQKKQVLKNTIQTQWMEHLHSSKEFNNIKNMQLTDFNDLIENISRKILDDIKHTFYNSKHE